MNVWWIDLLYCRYQRNGHAAIRIGSWNLDRMCMEKSSNMGVREVVCRTILENRLSIVCLQEVYESSALQLICDELNHPKLRRCNDWKDNSRYWKFLTNIRDADTVCVNGLGLLYDASRCQLVNDECFDIPLSNCALDEVSLWYERLNWIISQTKCFAISILHTHRHME